MDPSSLDTPLDAEIVDQPPPGGWREMVDNRWVVLGTLFFVTAALGLPLLWASRGFTRSQKGVLTVVVCVYTALLLYLFWLVMQWAYLRIIESL